MARGYAVIGPKGLVTVESSARAAIERAGREAPNVTVEEDAAHGGLGGLFGLDAVPAARMPELALQMSGLPRLDTRAVMSMSIEEAHRRLIPYFPKTIPIQGKDVPLQRWLKKSEMIAKLLGQNYKTGKATPEAPSFVQGLALMPAAMAKESSAHALPMSKLGLCAGSSAGCRASCLVFAGQNTTGIYKVIIKRAKTEALQLEPTAFARILIEACRRHVEPRKKPAYEPFVRLNVLSDIPWEIVLPGLFEMFPKGRFYDYTKVPARSPPANYDLTFSWSGVNEGYVKNEIDVGRRVAVVFLLPGSYFVHREGALPKRFMGLKVVDGDISDVRPRDPAPCIVGLRYKLAKGQGFDPRSSAFVVPVTEVDGQLVAAKGARQDNIEDPDERAAA